jgi:acyl-CoA thioester hydrolase
MMIDFLKPALMDDVLSISTQVSKIGGASIEMWQEIRRGDDALLTAKVRIAVVGGGKARRFPTEILAKLKTLAGSGPLAQGSPDRNVTQF